MNAPHFYNENDPKAAAWLRELVRGGHIPAGVVDERSIADIRPADLSGFVQCHFFAGIGGWPLALRYAGWPDDKPAWTGSAPCPPFSAAGKKKACPECGGKPIPHPLKTGVFACVPCGHEWFADGRHLYPEFYRLIRDCRPATVFGEQVAGADGLIWLAGVRATLEALGYGVGSSDLCAAWKAPHLRQRLYWLAHAKDADGRRQQPAGRTGSGRDGFAGGGTTGTLADVHRERFEGRAQCDVGTQQPGEQTSQRDDSVRRRDVVRLGDTESGGCRELWDETFAGSSGHAERPSGTGSEHVGTVANVLSEGLERLGRDERDGDQSGRLDAHEAGSIAESGGAGAWDNFDIIQCRDGKARRIESPSLEMADGLPKGLAAVRPECISKAEAEVRLYAEKTNNNPSEAVSDLWYTLCTSQVWSELGGRASLCTETLLLAFLRQLADQGWAFAQSVLRTGEEAAEGRVRGMRIPGAASRPSCERGLEGQPTRQSTDSLHLLSSVLARHAQEAWAEALRENAADCFPLAHGVIGRVGLLRGYGNAIVPQLAAQFIQAATEAIESQ